MSKFVKVAIVVSMIASMCLTGYADGWVAVPTSVNNEPSVDVQMVGGIVNGSANSTSTANASLASSVVFDTSSKIWENLTYKGGKKAYDEMINKALGYDKTDLEMVWADTGESILPDGISVVSRLYKAFMGNLSRDNMGNLVVDGYIYGTPIVVKKDPKPVASSVASSKEESSQPESSKEESSQPESSKEENSAPEEQVNTKEPDAATVAAITPRLKQGMNYVTSPREELKVANFLLEDQRSAVETQVKERNTEVSQWNDTSVLKTGYTGVKDVFRKLFRTDKMVISSLVQESETEVTANLTIPILSDWKNLPEELLSQFSSDDSKTGKDLDGIETLLVSPLGNRAAFYNGDDAKFEQAMTFYTDFAKVSSLVDVYTKYPKLFSDSTMSVRMVKEGSSWNMDKESMIVTATINGKTVKLPLLV